MQCFDFDGHPGHELGRISPLRSRNTARANTTADFCKGTACPKSPVQRHTLLPTMQPPRLGQFHQSGVFPELFVWSLG